MQYTSALEFNPGHAVFEMTLDDAIFEHTLCLAASLNHRQINSFLRIFFIVYL